MPVTWCPSTSNKNKMDSSSKNSTKRRRLSFNNGGGDHQVSTNHNVSAAPSVSSSSAASAAAAPSASSSSAASSSSVQIGEVRECGLNLTEVQSEAVQQMTLMQGRVVVEDLMTKDPRTLGDFVGHTRSVVECLLKHSLLRLTDLPGAVRLPEHRGTNVASLPCELWIQILVMVQAKEKVSIIPVVCKDLAELVRRPIVWPKIYHLRLSHPNMATLWNWCPSWCDATDVHFALGVRSTHSIKRCFRHLLSVRRLTLTWLVPVARGRQLKILQGLPVNLEHLRLNYRSMPVWVVIHDDTAQFLPQFGCHRLSAVTIVRPDGGEAIIQCEPYPSAGAGAGDRAVPAAPSAAGPAAPGPAAPFGVVPREGGHLPHPPQRPYVLQLLAAARQEAAASGNDMGDSDDGDETGGDMSESDD